MEVKYLKEGDIFNKIKETVLDLHPILDEEATSFDKACEFEINMDFLKDKKDDITKIAFMIGDHRLKKDIDKNLFMKGLLSINELNDLIFYLLSSHDIMDIETKIDTKISLVFSTKKCDDIDDMNYSKFILTLNAEKYPDHFMQRKKIIDQYFDWILENFYEKLKDTNYIKLCKIQYYANAYVDIINSLDEEKFNLFMSLLTKDDLCNILINLPYDRFFEVFNSFEQENEKLELVKK